ncbi:MAG: rod shape-determining protein RodA [Clostridia bacterium]|nr:rod shape-determining protein RodA [Clostridia bacterium]
MQRFFDKRSFRNIDWVLAATILAVALFGFVCLAAAMATPATGEEQALSEKLANLNPYLVIKQIVWFLLGAACVVVIMMMDFSAVRDLTPFVYTANVVLLFLLYFLANVTKGTVSWYSLGGVGFQPSEIMKLSLMLMLARMFSIWSVNDRIETLADLWKPALIVLIPFLLVALQPDLGTAAVLLCIGVGIALVVGVSIRLVMLILGSVVAASPLIWLMLSDMQKDRVRVFFDSTFDTSNAGYNVSRSRIAIGSGQLWGKGVFSEGNLTQLDWVPVRESDFIYAVTGEIFGFIGGLLLIILYGIMIWRIIRIALRSRDRFNMFIAIGVACMIFAHVFENIGMTMGIMPVTGIPLPLFSYGGSNMLTTMIALGMVLNIGTQT